MDRDVSDRIRERAYEIWMATGCGHGHAERHWFAAEQEILCGSLRDAKPAEGAVTTNKRRGNAKRSKQGLRAR